MSFTETLTEEKPSAAILRTRSRYSSVFARASFGVFGANLPALMRAGVACGWFGIQTWIGGGAIFVVMGRIFGDGSWWTDASKIAIGFGDPIPWTQWLSFAVFWFLNILIIWRGMDAVRRFENWAAPFVLIVAIVLLIGMTIKAGGLGPLLEDHGTVGWSLDKFWFGLFPPALMGMIAFWSTLSLNMPDFTRFGKSQRTQAIGQALGLPTTMTVFPLIAVLVTSATKTVYGDYIWDPVALVGKFDNVIVVILALFTGAGGRMILYRPGQPPVDAPGVPRRYQVQKSLGQLDNAVKLREVRRDIARVNTVLKEKQVAR